MAATERTDEAYTGLRREANAWGIYLRGRRVGECVRFTEAQQKLAEAQAAERAKESTPRQQQETQKVTIVVAGRRDFPGSRVIRDQVIELVQVGDAPPRPPKARVTLTEALAWLLQSGWEPEGMSDGLGMAKWTSLTGPGQLDARRACTFVRAEGGVT